MDVYTKDEVNVLIANISREIRNEFNEKYNNIVNAVDHMTPKGKWVNPTVMARMLKMSRTGLLARYSRGLYKEGHHFKFKDGKMLWDFAAVLKG